MYMTPVRKFQFTKQMKKLLDAEPARCGFEQLTSTLLFQEKLYIFTLYFKSILEAYTDLCCVLSTSVSPPGSLYTASESHSEKIYVHINKSRDNNSLDIPLSPLIHLDSSSGERSIKKVKQFDRFNRLCNLLLWHSWVTA